MSYVWLVAMNTNRLALKTARLRVATLQAELVSPETVRLGKAAVASVQRALDDAEWRLGQLTASKPAARVVSWAEAL